jgi:hypothetical protein
MGRRPSEAEERQASPRPRTDLPAMAGGSPEADTFGTGSRAGTGATAGHASGQGAPAPGSPVDPDAPRRIYLLGPALLATAATVFFGVIPQPLVDWAEQAGAAISQFLA